MTTERYVFFLYVFSCTSICKAATIKLVLLWKNCFGEDLTRDSRAPARALCLPWKYGVLGDRYLYYREAKVGETSVEGFYHRTEQGRRWSKGEDLFGDERAPRAAEDCERTLKA